MTMLEHGVLYTPESQEGIDDEVWEWDWDDVVFAIAAELTHKIRKGWSSLLLNVCLLIRDKRCIGDAWLYTLGWYSPQ